MEVFILIFIILVCYLLNKPSPQTKREQKSARGYKASRKTPEKIGISKKELDRHLQRLEEAEKRDHRTLSQRRDKTAKSTTRPWKEISFSIVGMRYYNFSFDLNQQSNYDEIILKREPDNPHDRNAVAVYVYGEKCGHINREKAEIISPILLRTRNYRTKYIGHYPSSIAMKFMYQ